MYVIKSRPHNSINSFILACLLWLSWSALTIPQLHFFKETSPDLQMVAIIEWRDALTKFILAHEIGHLFGCQHDDRFANRDEPLAEDFEFGYFIDYPENEFLNTIMA